MTFIEAIWKCDCCGQIGTSEGLTSPEGWIEEGSNDYCKWCAAEVKASE